MANSSELSRGSFGTSNTFLAITSRSLVSKYPPTFKSADEDLKPFSVRPRPLDDSRGILGNIVFAQEELGSNKSPEWPLGLNFSAKFDSRSYFR